MKPKTTQEKLDKLTVTIYGYQLKYNYHERINNPTYKRLTSRADKLAQLLTKKNGKIT